MDTCHKTTTPTVSVESIGRHIDQVGRKTIFALPIGESIIGRLVTGLAVTPPTTMLCGLSGSLAQSGSSSISIKNLMAKANKKAN